MPHVLQMFTSYISHFGHVLGFISFIVLYLLHLMSSIYSCKYDSMFLDFTNLSFSSLLLKPLFKFQSETSLGL